MSIIKVISIAVTVLELWWKAAQGIRCPSWKSKYICVESQKVQKLLQKSSYLFSINLQAECLYTIFFSENKQAIFVEKVLLSKSIFFNLEEKMKMEQRKKYRKIYTSSSFFFFLFLGKRIRDTKVATNMDWK